MKSSREVKRMIAKIRKKWGSKNGVICGALMFWPDYKDATCKKSKPRVKHGSN